MTKKTLNILILVIFTVAVVVGVFLMFGKATAPTTSGIIFYYGDGCPHCLKVEEFIKNNNLDVKIKIERKEVWHNQASAAEMTTRYQQCGLPTDNMGVPFLWDSGKCYTGDTNIINYFASKL